jgi:serine/threonine-protein kinase
VFRAYDAGREKLVAVKLFKLDLPPERVHQLVAAFEQLIAAELTHPVMAMPLATGITDVSAYLAQDYVAAESLDLAVREYGPAPAADALRVAAQLAGALDFAAVVNIAHGALHPRDVLLSADETRLTGVGVARALESVGIAAPVRRPYTAPERIAGAAWDRRADVFSLAALIHELLWARRITGTGDHIADTLTELPGADLRALQQVFARALADDPSARFDTALEFVDSLKSAFPSVAIKEPVGRKKPTRRSPETEPQLPLDEPDNAVSGAGDVVSGFSTLPVEAEIEEPRFQEVETAPAAAAPPEDITPMRHEPVQEPPPISMIEQSRSAVWPLVASLLIGLALGFAGGYGVGTRERPAVATASVVDGVPAPTSAAGRDATEVAIAQPTPAAPSDPIATPPEKAPEPPKPVAAARREPPQSRTVSTPAPRTSADRAVARRAAPSRPAPRPTPAAAAVAPASATTGRYQGGLNVDSRPTGAKVFLDGRLVGTTPLTMEAVRAGEHAIRLERDGYRHWSSSVRVVAAESNRVTASLER